MNYSDIEKLAKVFEKCAQSLPDIEEGGFTIHEDIIPAAEVEISNRLATILMREFKKMAVPGEPPPVPPRSYVAVTRFNEPGTEFTIGLGREIPDQILNRAILELDTWLKNESRYRNNQYMKNASWKVTIV